MVDLDTSTIMPDVFGLRAFDSLEPVVRMLPGDFANTICVLVLDATVVLINHLYPKMNNTSYSYSNPFITCAL